MSFDEKINHGFIKNETGGVVYFTIPAFVNSGLCRHAFASRIGGVSKGVYESLCFSLSREKNIDNFRQNTRIFANAVGVDFDKITAVNYAHGDGIYSLKKEDAGKGITRENDIPKCDALIVDNKDVAAMTMHADCVPIFVLDVKKGISAIAHAGWRGVVKKLPCKIGLEFIAKYGSKPEDLLYGIGPHISKCCFEVGEDVEQVFVDTFGVNSIEKRNGRIYADMQYAILRQLEDIGILPENITVSDLCTHCRQDLFYSHRRDKGNTGAMACLMQNV